MPQKVKIGIKNYTLVEAAENYGLPADRVSARINRLGWTAGEALGIVEKQRGNYKRIYFRDLDCDCQDSFLN